MAYDEEKYGKVVDKDESLFSKWDVTDKHFCVNQVNKTIGDVCTAVERRLSEGLLNEFDSYGNFCYPLKPTDPWPKMHWLAIYYVTGGSEGFWVHVDVIGGEGDRKLVWLAKTLHEGDGREWCEKLVHELCTIMKP